MKYTLYVFIFVFKYLYIFKNNCGQLFKMLSKISLLTSLVIYNSYATNI